jgi:hypothetical protein
MDAMIKALLKQFGFTPESVKQNIDTATQEYANLKLQLNNIEAKLDRLIK